MSYPTKPPSLLCAKPIFHLLTERAAMVTQKLYFVQIFMDVSTLIAQVKEILAKEENVISVIDCGIHKISLTLLTKS